MIWNQRILWWWKTRKRSSSSTLGQQPSTDIRSTRIYRVATIGLPRFSWAATRRTKHQHTDNLSTCGHLDAQQSNSLSKLQFSQGNTTMIRCWKSSSFVGCPHQISYSRASIEIDSFCSITLIKDLYSRTLSSSWWPLYPRINKKACKSHSGITLS